MIIKCPRCQARATLPDSKEGAKVKCGECGRIYVAAPPGRASHSKGRNTGVIVGIVVAVVALGVFIAIGSGHEEEPAQAAPKAEAPPAPEKEWVDAMAWEGPVVQFCVKLHDAVHGRDLNSVRAKLDDARLWAIEQGQTGTAEELDTSTYDALAQIERLEHANRYAQSLIEGDGYALVGEWEPFDGEVLELTDGYALVRVDTTSRDPNGGIEKRTVEWKLSRDQRGDWHAYGWSRYISPEEAARNRRGGPKGYEKVTLSDGSIVHEREPEHLEHLADTHPDVRKKIDELYAKMIDLDLTTEGTRARDAIVEIGRPAIPILLNGLYETPLDSEENAIRANIIVVALRDITGQYHGYKPQVLEGSGAGTTEERRQSAIKQWFAWWYKNESKFEQKEETSDGLEGLIELTDKEKAWLERNSD